MTVPVSRLWQPFWKELRRLGDIEGQNLSIDRYSGEGRPEGYGDLAREVVNRNPDVIVAATNPFTQAIHAANGAIPIVLIGGDVIEAGWRQAWKRRVAMRDREKLWGGRRGNGNFVAACNR